MKKEIQILMVGSLFVNACSPIVAQAMENNQNNTPKTSTPEALPTFIKIPTQTETPYQIPTLEPVTLTAIPKAILTPDILYFSQLDYPNEHFKDGSSWRDSGCGLMAGAMLTKTDPYTYFKNFIAYLKTQNLDGTEQITRDGSYIKDHIGTLESLHYRPIQIPTEGRDIVDIKADIKNYTDNGIPVLIKAVIRHNGRQGHYTIAIGVNENGEIIYNDPAYGQGVTIPRSKYTQERIEFQEFYAILPPQK